VTADDRARRTRAADDLCRSAYADHGVPDAGFCLIAVGGYGRGELAPYSDLDAVLVHADHLDAGDFAERLWYPIWDAGHRLDHAVRSLSEMVDAAASDLKVALGLLDLRHLAGDPGLTLRLRTTVLAAWRRDARRRLPRLAQLREQRHELMGELAHASVPDLKEAEGGLRDAGILAALVATWLVDASWPDLEPSRQALLDVRDEVQALAGRPGDRITPEMWDQLAAPLGLADAAAVQVHVRALGRRISHLSRLTWRRVGAMLARPTSVRGARRPELQQAARGVAISRGEVVLDGRVAPSDDAALLLRAATVAAERDLVLAPATAARLARESAPLAEPWSHEGRTLLVRLLAAGRGLLPTWETLDQTGALRLILPEWDRIRALPHASVIHRFTVDRHVVQTCMEASALLADVSRPDLLVVAALLHDIGKGEAGDHAVGGAKVAREVAVRFGFPPGDVDIVASLVRWHLLLAETATTRDPQDPVTVAMITERIPDRVTLSLLLALSQADALATSTKAWSSWRAHLIRDLAWRADQALADRGATLVDDEYADVPLPQSVQADPDRVEVQVVDDREGAVIRVFARDRVGLLADVSAVLAHLRVPVLAARAWPQGEVGVSEWHTGEPAVDPAVLRERIQAEVDGRTQVKERLARPLGHPARVLLRQDGSLTATVLEVRTPDRPGLVHQVCAALAGVGVAVRSAHADTLGPQAVDVFYVQEPTGVPLGASRAAEARAAVLTVLTGAVVDG